MLYRLLYRLLLQRLDPERGHALAGRSLHLVGAMPGKLWLLRALGRPDPCLRVQALGSSFPSPLGVAAGVDKEATWFEPLGALGFGFVEVGTVTAVGQPGNERPRVFRIPSHRALLNRMGFPNPGAEAVAERLRSSAERTHAARTTSPRPQTGPTEANCPRSGPTIVGANVGKSRIASLDTAAEDYREAVRAVGPFCDYVAINVSSPNTPGLRDLQTPDHLRAIVGAIREELSALQAPRPLLVKLSPDLSDEELDALADVALELKLDGIVAVNTTLDRSAVEDCPEIAGVQGGGVSGPPLAPKALAVLRRLRARVGERLVLVSVGGIETGQDAWERILAGATLVQGYTGFVYGGPGWARHINRELAERTRDAGYASIQEAVGAAASGSA